MPRSGVEGDYRYNPVWIDGERATKDPIRIRWTRPKRGTSGTGKPLFSRYESCELELGVMHEDDFEWWKDMWMEDSLHTVDMPHEEPLTTGSDESDAVYSFTGVAFEDLRWTRRDEWHYGVTAVFSHILIT